MNKLFNIEDLKEIYLISNTASFLYTSFSKNNSLVEITKELTQEKLINEFENIAKREINKIDELVLAYSIYISILQFDNEKTFEFINTSGNINFEWFPELKHIYLSRLRTFNYNNMEIKDFHSKPQKIYNQSDIEINNQLIEFA